eukprot:c12283_g1_i2.p1 GENE.c12283_g1_i2~~c12283_g1_i2.p1  ORF type:complete len:375 (-),score=94.54 c12283_g1_i2:143-1204(-)
MTKLHGWDFWRSISSPTNICAPMVDGSELAFRMLTRKYGVTLAYTPMLHSKNFSEDPKYRKSFFSTCEEDGPLFTQFCANDPEILLTAARFVEDHTDAVDINFGCPQGIARRGRYGAFLLEDTDLVCSLVNVLHVNLKVPVTAKIRLLPDLQHTIHLAQRIQEAGASVLTVHGRTKEMNKQFAGLADWSAVKAIREKLDIPVVSNGNIRFFEDVQKCLDATGCCGVMSAEGLLANPALFGGPNPPHPVQLAREYLTFADQYAAPDGFIRGHLFWILNPPKILAQHVDLRNMLQHANTRQEMFDVVTELEVRYGFRQPESVLATESSNTAATAVDSVASKTDDNQPTDDLAMTS